MTRTKLLSLLAGLDKAVIRIEQQIGSIHREVYNMCDYLEELKESYKIIKGG